MTNKEILKILEKAAPHLEIYGDVKAINAIYISPAQSLRNSADAIEAKDSAIRDFRKLITDLKTIQKVSNCCGAGVDSPEDKAGEGICMECKEHCEEVNPE